MHNEVSVLISEWANGGDLLEYIKANYKTMQLKTWRVILFQMLSVLSVIQAKYPGFRHNDLKANNLLIHSIESRNKNNKVHIYDHTVSNYPYIKAIGKYFRRLITFRTTFEGFTIRVKNFYNYKKFLYSKNPLNPDSNLFSFALVILNFISFSNFQRFTNVLKVLFHLQIYQVLLFRHHCQLKEYN